MTLEEIKVSARNNNKSNLYITIEELCDYIARLENQIMVKSTKGETSKEDIKKKGLKNG